MKKEGLRMGVLGMGVLAAIVVAGKGNGAGDGDGGGPGGDSSYSGHYGRKGGKW